MSLKKNSSDHAARGLQLASALLICWGLILNTNVEATNTLRVPAENPVARGKIYAPAVVNDPSNMQVLSPKDADLYRAVFEAQAKADWDTADRVAQEISNKRLMGHVLADRYQRRTASPHELREWLASYPDLPEAPSLYKRWQRLPEAKTIKLERPESASAWMGGDSYGGAASFKISAKGKPLPSSSKIDHALHRNEAYLAEAYMDAEQKKHPLPEQRLASAKGRIAASYFFKGKVDDAYRLGRETIAYHDALGSWIAGLSAWKKNDPKDAGIAFASLAAQPELSARDRAAASFWAYRAFSRQKDIKSATYWLTQAADQPHSFYGFLAANLLNRGDQASWQLPTLDAKNKSILVNHRAGWRALALIQIGKPELAESELKSLNPQSSHDLQEALLAVAEAQHMPSMALRLGGLATDASGKPYDGALYPLPPWQPAEGFQVDRALMYALMRHESHFVPTAVSDSGACGLMQLMPATAKLMSGGHGASRGCSANLLDPATNMGLGQSYVRRLAAQPMIGDNLLYLLAAYNGGPGRLQNWVDSSTRKDPLLFIESLPVHETRDYIQQVLVHYWMYHARLGQPDASLRQLAHGEWPRVKLHDQMPATPLPRMQKADAGAIKVATR